MILTPIEISNLRQELYDEFYKENRELHSRDIHTYLQAYKKFEKEILPEKLKGLIKKLENEKGVK